jgi:hypothetical protein
VRSDIPRNVLNVYRYEHHGYRGWAVSVKRGGSPYVEYFADGRQGPQASFERAVAYRDRLLKRVPAFNKLKRSYVRNTTGEIGVARCIERTRAGTRFVRYAATWPKVSRGTNKRSFSATKYGDRRARRLAVQARRRGVGETLRGRAKRGKTTLAKGSGPKLY